MRLRDLQDLGQVVTRKTDIVHAIEHFPPLPRGLKGRTTELTTLARTLEAGARRLALVGGGGSGKSMLAAALGHRVAAKFGRRLHWFRIGAWDAWTLFEMLAIRFGTPRARDGRLDNLRAFLVGEGPRLVVLDNHEDDAATARVLDELADTPTTFVITARRCLLGGVLVYPVTAPLVTLGRSAFPRVASLTRVLRWNALALDIADGLIGAKALTLPELTRFLGDRGVGRVRVVAHEDDVPEVAALVDWSWQHLGAASRRVLGVLGHVEGDHVDVRSLAHLARVRDIEAALAPLETFRLVQQPLRGRFTLHAVVRHAIRQRTTPEPDRWFSYYLRLLEREPGRLALEQTHLFAAMDHCNRANDLDGMLRIERLLAAQGL